MRLAEQIQDGGVRAPAGLDDGGLHLWFSVPDPAVPAALLERLLQPEELARGRTMRLERRRNEYLLTRAMVRRVLSAYSPIAPSAWRSRNPEFDS